MPATLSLWRAAAQANTIDGGAGGNDQIAPATIQLANGNLLVAWQSNTDIGAGQPSGSDVIAQILDPAGNKIGGEFRLNTLWSSWQEGDAKLAALGNGGFASVYTREGAAAGGGDSSVALQIYDAAGGGIASVLLAGDTGSVHFGQPDIAASSLNTIMIAYVRDAGGGDQDVIYQVRSPTGALLHSATVALNGVAGAGAGIDSLSVTALANGNFALAYSDADSASDSDIDLKLFDSAGNLLKSVAVASGAIRNDEVQVAALSGGGFVVAWTQDASGGSDSNIVARTFDAGGVAVGPAFAVATTTAGNQHAPTVGALADGSFVVAWIDDAGNDLRAQRIDSSGNKIGGEILVVDGALFAPAAPTVTGLADGRFSISWTMSGLSGDHDIQSAIFDPRELANGGTAGNDVIAGTVFDDTLLAGGAGDDRIYGGAGNDTLDGGLGADVLDGGDGIDTASYANATAGVYASLTTGIGETGEAAGDTLSGIENLTGSAYGDQLFGDGKDNILTGGDGVDHLTGGGGADTLIGGTGSDMAHYDDETTDLVISLANAALNTGTAAGDTFDGIEGLVGGSGNDQLTGDANTNFLFGRDGNDVIDGGAGYDYLYGGKGDDTFVVDAVFDQILEVAGEGTDTVKASVSYALADNIENLILTGAADIDGEGNALDNALTGNGGGNLLDGKAGADAMAGGGGDDVYVVDNAGDTVTEASGKGNDTVKSGIAFTLGANVENLLLTGAANIDGTGNGLANIVTGNDGANTLDGKAGADALAGGLGDDTYIVDNAGDTVSEAGGGGVDLVVSTVAFTLGDGLENLTLAGNAIIDGTGNGLDNTLTGNAKKNVLTGLAGNDTLDGQGGADTMVGGQGDDAYVVDNAGDIVTETANQGTDKVLASVSYTLSSHVEILELAGSADLKGTGNTLANTLTGNDGANTLDGLGGADVMTGGKGDDTYIVDNVGDIVHEVANAGWDTVKSSVTYTISPDVDVLILTGNAIIDGTGNEQFNTLIGNAKSNVLSGLDGDDILDGQGGADTMIGGIGDDTFVVNHAGDTVIEQEAEGTDLVQSSISYTLGDHVEHLTLTGQSNIAGTGNAEVNVIIGNDKNNVIDGMAGGDEMAGGLGDDTYYVDDFGDSVLEAAGGGIDHVYTSVGFSAAAQEIEFITLTGMAAENVDGNGIANTIEGNGAANVLKGGGGADTFVFSTALGGGNIDFLADFATTIDKIALDNAIFRKAGPLGALADGAFAMGAVATEADDRILYDTMTGALYYDADGNKAGGVEAVQFALLETGIDDLAASDFVVV